MEDNKNGGYSAEGRKLRPRKKVSFAGSDRGENRNHESGEHRAYSKPYGERRSYGEGEHRSYGQGERRQGGSYGERKPYGSSERRPYNNSESRPYGERRPYGQGERQGGAYGERKPYALPKDAPTTIQRTGLTANAGVTAKANTGHTTSPTASTGRTPSLTAKAKAAGVPMGAAASPMQASAQKAPNPRSAATAVRNSSPVSTKALSRVSTA